MTEASRSLFLELAWFPPDQKLLGSKARPLCLATWRAMKLMGLTLLNRDSVLDPEEEYRQLAAYRWLHTEDPAVISEMVWNDSWREVMNLPYSQDDPPTELLNQWHFERERILSLLEATEIEIRPRPRKGEDNTPFEVVGPHSTAHELRVVRGATGQSVKELAWDLPLYQFRQIYHAEMRWNHFWTVRPGKKIAPDEFDGFGESVMENLRSQVSDETFAADP